MNKLALLIIFTILLIGCKENEVPITKKAIDPITYSMDHNADFILENPEIHSISIGIYKDGKTYTNYYGEIDKGKGNKPNDNSIFEIASVTKTFTGFITAQAVLDGKLSLEDDIRTYLDGSFNNLEYENRPILIKDLLTHTSGIRRDFSEVLTKMFSLDATGAERKAVSEYDTENLIEDLSKFKLDTLPGKRYDYSPIVAPEILALILQNTYKKSYNELLNQFILSKAEMKHTSVHTKEEDQKHQINGYTENNQLVVPVQMPMTGAGGGLKSTVPDLLKYIEFLLESKDPAIEEMRRPLFFDEEEGDQYGYFWMLGDDDSMQHSGGTAGSLNWLILLPKYNSGFTVSFNCNGDYANDLINRIASWIYNDIENYPLKNPYFPVRKAILENAEKGIQFYKQLKIDSVTTFDFTNESMLNRIGYELLREDKTNEAIKIFQLLVSEFPNSGNPYDSLAESYFLNEQYDLSLTNYKKALELDPENKNAVMMIQKIEEISN